MNRWLPLLSVTRPVSVIMAAVAACVLGAIALSRIPLDLLPSGFENPYIWVEVPWRNATPLETETRILRPMEEQLATVAGIKRMESSAGTSDADVELELHQGVDVRDAYNQVVDRMERVLADLPPEADRYWIYRWNPADEPVLWLGVTIDPSVEDPYHLVQNVVRRNLERIPGVGQVEAWGVDEKIVWVDFDREALDAHGVNLGGVLSRLAADNVQVSGGRITERGSVRYLRSLARFDSLDDLRAWPVLPGLALGDVATVGFRSEVSKTINRINGRKAAAVGAYRESGANTVEVCRNVRAAIEDMKGDPRLAGLEFYSFFDQGEEIEKSLGQLTGSLYEGGLFSIVILFLFLREWRMTLLISACIPFSILLTVTVVYFTGGSMNLLTMMGMMIAVGMVVDNAIVVVETIFKARQEGLDRKHAAVEGTAEVSLAITLSTLTSIVVFLPIILMSGDAMFSFFMGQLGFPVCWALLASLVVALLFTPLTTTLMSSKHIKAEARWLSWLTGAYDRLLRRVLRFRVDTLVFVAAVALVTVLVPMKSVGCNEENESAPTEFILRFQVPTTLGHEERVGIVETFERLLADHRDRWGIRFYRSRLRESRSDGWLYVSLLEEDALADTALPRNEVLADVRRSMPDLPGVQARVGWQDDVMGARSINFVLHGPDTESLQRVVDDVASRLEQIPGVMGAQQDADAEGSREIRLGVDRAAVSRFGLTGEAVGRAVAFAMRGFPLPDMWLGGRDVSVYARMAEEDRRDLQTLLDLPIQAAVAPATPSVLTATSTLVPATVATTAPPTTVPLRAVALPEVTRGWGRIQRTDRRTGMTLTLDLEEGTEPQAAWAAAEQALGEISFPRGYGWEKGGWHQEQEESDSARSQALVLSVVFVFLLMGMLFESLLLPLAVITTVPMAMLGVYWTLYLTDTPIDITAGVGLVVLVGVVVNNGIVLIDYVTQLRKQGMDRTEALVQAGVRRLRPILMTALTTIVGVLPMAFGHDRFLDIPYAPMGRVVGGGLASATILTLFLVPLLYSLLDDLRVASRRWVAWIWPR